MICCPFVNQVGRALQINIPALLALLLLSGCDTDRYSEDMVYPVRSDPLVVARPTGTPTRPDPPGDLYQLLANPDNFIPPDAEGKPQSAGGQLLSPVGPKGLKEAQRQEIQKVLTDLFGTPANPKVDFDKTRSGADETELEALAEAPRALKLDSATLKTGSRLYRRHCLHCHGLPGDGHGPTAPWVNPHPRDYRQGIFKFTSTSGDLARKPRRQDLLRTLRNGIEGTAMPPFGLLPGDELEDLVSYVIHLSLRGQAEFDTMKSILIGGDLAGDSIKEDLALRLRVYATRDWLAADKNMIKPGEYPGEAKRLASVQKGFALFVKPGPASCISCHKDYGRANEFKFEDWGTIGRPADLTRGVYRGGRRPVDLYWRIDSGINGTAMPSFHGSLLPEEVWQIVDFVQALPYPQMLPDDIRQEVYPGVGAPAVAAR